MGLFITSLSGSSQAQSEQLILPINYPNNPGYQGISNGVLIYTAQGNYQKAPTNYTILDKTFLGLCSPDATNNKQLVVVYDHYRNMVSDVIDTGLEFANGDSHHSPAIYPTGEGRMMIISTQRIIPGSSKTRLVSYSGADYDITTWTDWTSFDPSGIEYPHLNTFANGDIYSIERYGVTGTDWYSEIFRSTDNGQNWSVYNRFIEMETGFDVRPYPLYLHSEDDVLRTFINQIEFTPTLKQEWIYYLESFDGGITWENASGTFSKDTTTNPLTIAELQANYSVLNVPNALLRANYATLIDGILYLMGGIDVNNAMGLTYWNGSSWISSEVAVSGHVIAPSYSGTVPYSNSSVLKKEGSYLYWYGQELINGFAAVSLFRTNDNGLNWEFVEQLSVGDFDHITIKHSPVGSDIISFNKDYVDGSGDIFIKAI